MAMKPSTSCQVVGSLVVLAAGFLSVPSKGSGELSTLHAGFILGPLLMLIGKLADLRALTPDRSAFHHMMINWCLVPGAMVATVASLMTRLPSIVDTIFFFVAVALVVAYISIAIHMFWRRTRYG